MGRQSLMKRSSRAAISAALATAFCACFFGCFGSDPDGGSEKGFSVEFRLVSVKDSLPLDSLFVQFSLGDTGQPQEIAINLKTGVSSKTITAFEGQNFLLDFKVFSVGYQIGRGTATGRLARGAAIDLDPVWDNDAISRAKKDLGLGVILPPYLSLHFAQAVAGKPFELPLDSLQNTKYKWAAKVGESSVLSGEGHAVRMVFGDSLAGRSALLRVSAVSGSITREEKSWVVQILPALSGDRVSRRLTRTDTNTAQGVAEYLRYDGGLLRVIESFSSLDPDSGARPEGVESLFYEGTRLRRTMHRRPDGSVLDSSFGYNSAGLIAAIEVKSGAQVLVDSFHYSGERLSASSRRVNGTQTEAAVYVWTGVDARIDSVFSLSGSARQLTRVIANRFVRDSLVERGVSQMRGASLQPYKREVTVYNGLGLRAFRQVFTEGATPLLEQSETCRYDARGRLESILTRDEVTGDLLLAVTHEYESAVAFASTFAAQRHARKTLAAARFAHTEWVLNLATAQMP